MGLKLAPEIITEADGSITLALDELELYVNNANMETAIAEMIKDLKIYAQDYMERSQLFLLAPNRKGHFPYLLRVLLCENDDEIGNFLEIKNAT